MHKSTILLLATVMIAGANTGSRRTTPLSEPDAIQTGVEAYIYGYPLVTMEMTRRVMTNAARPDGTHAPMGQFRSLSRGHRAER
jgi:hypothetical protein